MSLVDELAKLHDLKESGALTDEEYQLAKQRLLREDEDAATPPPAPIESVVESIADTIGEESGSLGVAANRYVSYQYKATIIGAIVAIVVLIVFAIIFLSAKADFDRDFHRNTPFEQQLPEGFGR